MGKVRTKSKHPHRSKHRGGDASRKTDVKDLAVILAQASQYLQLGSPDEALPLAEKAVRLCSQSANAQYNLPALNLLAQIEIELGDPDAAREHFKAAVELDPAGEEPEELGGGAEKFLWLAQLSEEGGRDSIKWFERGGAILERKVRELQGKMDGEEELGETKASLASTLCAMIEVWMTDLSLEPEAEVTCEALITQALIVSEPPIPHILQTLASIRLSQSRLEDAQSALQRSIDSWKDLDLESPLVPDFPTRISLVRLLMEAELEELALEVVERLVGEDDQSIEAWYLGGWCLWLLGHKEGEAVDAEDQKALLMSSREWLRNCLKLYDLLEYEDDRLRDHAVELVSGLDQQLGSQEIEEDEEEEEWEDDTSEESDKDHDMDES